MLEISSKGIIKKDGIELKLPYAETELICILYENRNKIISRNILIYRIWGFDKNNKNKTLGTEMNLKKTICEARKKIGCTKENRIIETCFKKGYRWNAENKNKL